MRSFKAASLLVLGLFVLCPGPVGAAGRKIEFTPSSADQIIKADVFPKKAAPAPSAARTTTQQREARIRSIVELFTRHNPKLTQKRARSYAEYILQAGEKFGQDPFVLAAMIVHESTARYDAVSRSGDYGLMQVRWSVHKKRIQREYPQVKTAKDVLDPRINILIGTEIFAEYRAAAGPDLRSGLLRYSAGNKKLANKIFATKGELERSYQKYLKALK